MKESKVFTYSLLVVIGTALLLYLGYRCTAIPYDDAYSVFMIKGSYSEIASMTAKDVHPPFYYWGLKAFSSVFGNSFFALRAFSVVGILATLLLGCFIVRRLFGHRVAMLFMLLTLIFPVTQYLATDIRMYSWTMFFVSACGLFAYDVYKQGRLIDWTKFFITGICAAYLHNFGLLSVFWIYIILFVFLLRTKKKWYFLIACGVLFSVAYSPWLYQLIGQMSHVSEEYWIKPLTLNDLFLHIYYFYSPKEIGLPFTDFTKGQMMIALILLMGIQLILTLKVFISGFRKKEETASLSLLAFTAFLLPIATGFFVSIVFVPISVTRYMTCSFGLFILSMAFVLGRVYEYSNYRRLLYIFLALLFVDGGARYYSGLKYYRDTEIAYRKIHDFMDADTWKEQEIIANYFSFYVVPRLQLIAPCRQYAVLKPDSLTVNFEPFSFKTENKLASNQFILVHHNREAIEADFRQFQKTLITDYVIADSLQIEQFFFYKMKKK